MIQRIADLLCRIKGHKPETKGILHVKGEIYDYERITYCKRCNRILLVEHGSTPYAKDLKRWQSEH